MNIKHVKNVHLELSNICNLKCVMCPVNTKMKRKKEFLPFNLIKKIVNENPQIESYGLTNWGESLLHPRFLDILKYLKKKGKKTGIGTNAVLLTEEVSKKLIGLNLDRISFSLDAKNDDYESIRGYPYQKIKKNILRFLSLRKKTGKEQKIRARITATVFEENEHLIGDLKKEWNVIYDKSGSIGRRYARNDEIGTPFCITIDEESIKNKDVTIRERDTKKQIRVKISELRNILRKLIEEEIKFEKAGSLVK